jgi:O-antigen ligase
MLATCSSQVLAMHVSIIFSDLGKVRMNLVLRLYRRGSKLCLRAFGTETSLTSTLFFRIILLQSISRPMLGKSYKDNLLVSCIFSTLSSFALSIWVETVADRQSRLKISIATSYNYNMYTLELPCLLNCANLVTNGCIWPRYSKRSISASRKYR